MLVIKVHSKVSLQSKLMLQGWAAQQSSSPLVKSKTVFVVPGGTENGRSALALV
jgi:hypothetical protein